MKALTKTLIASTVTLSLALSSGFALAKGGGNERDPSQRYSYIFSQMELSEAQQTQVVDILTTLRDENQEQMRATMQSLRDQEQRPSEEEMQALRETHRAQQLQAITDQLNTVLSPAQTAEFVSYLEAHQPMMKHKPGGRHGHGDKDGRGR